MVKSSVIIPTYNKAAYLDLTLAGFEIQESAGEYEIIVVDDGSTDDTAEIVNSYQGILNIKYIFQPNNGRAAARNNALQVAEGEYIIFNDDDRIPSPILISEHLNTIGNSNIISIGSKHVVLTIYNEHLNLVYPLLVNLMMNNKQFYTKLQEKNQGEIKLVGANSIKEDFDSVITKYYLYEPFDNHTMIFNKYSKELNGFNFPWALGTTGNMAYLRKDDNVYFDEKYKGWGVEDTDFSYQLSRRGYKFVLARQATNFHQAHARGQNEIKELEQNIMYFCSKYNNLDVYLFARIFKGDISYFEANDLFDRIEKLNDEILIKDYLQLCKKRLE